MDSVLSVDNLYKEYRTGWRKPSRRALAGLNLEVPAGGMVGLLGPNGAGKTTTLKCIMGLVQPQGGSVRLFGEENTSAAVRKRVGFLPEQPYFDLYLTPRKLLTYYGRLTGLDTNTIKVRISYLLNLVGMEGEADLTMDRYSKGMLQRIGLAQALISEPELIILDEPSSGLDPLGKLQVRDLLEGLRRTGTTILISSHQLSEIEEICDSVVVIHKGRNVVSGVLDDLLLSKDEYEILLAEPAAQILSELPASASWMDGENRRLTTSKEDLNRVLTILADGGASIVEVRQRRISLEEFFLAQVGEGKWEAEE